MRGSTGIEHVAGAGTASPVATVRGGSEIAQRRALVVRGGWEGHEPVRATELFIPFLEGSGCAVRIEESTDVYADAAENRVVEHGAALGVDVEIVTKDPQIKGFSVVKRRWVVERTIGWLMHHRRLVRDYETRPDNSASMITIAMIDNLANVSPPKTPQPGENP